MPSMKHSELATGPVFHVDFESAIEHIQMLQSDWRI